MKTFMEVTWEETTLLKAGRWKGALKTYGRPHVREAKSSGFLGGLVAMALHSPQGQGFDPRLGIQLTCCVAKK